MNEEPLNGMSLHAFVVVLNSHRSLKSFVYDPSVAVPPNITNETALEAAIEVNARGLGITPTLDVLRS